MNLVNAIGLDVRLTLRVGASTESQCRSMIPRRPLDVSDEQTFGHGSKKSLNETLVRLVRAYTF